MIYLVSIKIPNSFVKKLYGLNKSITRKPSYPFHITLGQIKTRKKVTIFENLVSPGKLESSKLLTFNSNMAGLLFKRSSKLVKTHFDLLSRVKDGSCSPYIGKNFVPHMSTAFEQVSKEYLEKLTKIKISFIPKTYWVAKAKKITSGIVYSWNDVAEFEFKK